MFSNWKKKNNILKVKKRTLDSNSLLDDKMVDKCELNSMNKAQQELTLDTVHSSVLLNNLVIMINASSPSPIQCESTISWPI